MPLPWRYLQNTSIKHFYSHVAILFISEIRMTQSLCCLLKLFRERCTIDNQTMLMAPLRNTTINVKHRSNRTITQMGKSEYNQIFYLHYIEQNKSPLCPFGLKSGQMTLLFRVFFLNVFIPTYIWNFKWTVMPFIFYDCSADVLTKQNCGSA